jgi:hypothetical protein
VIHWVTTANPCTFSITNRLQPLCLQGYLELLPPFSLHHIHKFFFSRVGLGPIKSSLMRTGYEDAKVRG